MRFARWSLHKLPPRRFCTAFQKALGPLWPLWKHRVPKNGIGIGGGGVTPGNPLGRVDTWNWGPPHPPPYSRGDLQTPFVRRRPAIATLRRLACRPSTIRSRQNHFGRILEVRRRSYFEPKPTKPGCRSTALLRSFFARFQDLRRRKAEAGHLVSRTFCICGSKGNPTLGDTRDLLIALLTRPLSGHSRFNPRPQGGSPRP